VLEEGSGRLVLLIDRGVNPSHFPPGSFFQKDLDQPRAELLPPYRRQEVDVELGRIIVQARTAAAGGDESGQAREKTPEGWPEEQTAGERPGEGRRHYAPGLKSGEAPQIETAREVTLHGPLLLNHPKRPGAEVGPRADHQVGEEMGIEKRGAVAVIGRGSADFSHRGAILRFIKTNLHRRRIVSLAGAEATYHDIVQPLEHWHYEVWNGKEGAKDPTFEDVKFLFQGDLKGNVAAVAAEFEPSVKEIVFTKKSDPRQSDPAWLARYVGEYELTNKTIRIELAGSSLTLSITGQPLYHLLPGLAGEFILKEAPFISVSFTEDAQGRVISLNSNQPNGVFTAKRK
jgi:hypothetical protein